MARILFLLEDGFDDLEYYYARYRLLEEGHRVAVASSKMFSDRLVLDPETGSLVREHRVLVGKRGLEVLPDIGYEDALSREWDGIVIPGGRSPERVRVNKYARLLVERHLSLYKPVLAICHGPLVLASVGVLKGRRVTGHPGIGDDLRNAGALYTGSGAERDGCIVTVRHTTTIHEGMPLFLELLERGCL